MDEPQTSTNRLGKGMQLMAWVSLLGVLTLVFTAIDWRRYNPNGDAQGTSTGAINEVVLQANRQHHYVVNGLINGKKVIFLLDTGATEVSIPAHIASELSLPKLGRSQAYTANGVVNVFDTKIQSLQLGSIQLRNVQASINPGQNKDEILLGMTALKQIEFAQRGDQLTLRQYLID
ncbi:TIGR02281 family clan AA aspartic protease [Marinibactrum halimedae]|uniref:TIGR02281 family clan AA aspartic protease n=1 Tax=Marinibactrum halimedae TaxID=1444977 RepID=A0AA37T4N8_9GAMM|nr:TIGR02281 family clan AA aspartic protease [Marinibactrum halimedae]MCD9460353.1 TIGR02281 family clan AA aspartic protease [Marinibactrum halimedae]GLS26790.1 hypothetical protein GCM10007877_25090 [Marinibactrum halimedae]